MTAERFLIRTQGGPMDGETRVANAMGSGPWEWPLPDVLEYDRTGEYVKVGESSLSPQSEESRLVRGAWYVWRPADA